MDPHFICAKHANMGSPVCRSSARIRFCMASKMLRGVAKRRYVRRKWDIKVGSTKAVRSKETHGSLNENQPSSLTARKSSLSSRSSNVTHGGARLARKYITSITDGQNKATHDSRETFSRLLSATSSRLPTFSPFAGSGA